MEKYPPPDINRLEGYQKESISRLLQIMDEKKLDHAELERLSSELIELMASACRSDEDIDRIFVEVDRWVRWKRVQGYWLSYLLQMVTRCSGSRYHILSSILYSDSQLALGDDLGFHSLEVAVMSSEKTKKKYPDIEAFCRIEAAIKLRMERYAKFYWKWCTSFKYMDANPLSEHLYFEKTWIDLHQAFPQIGWSFANADPAVFQLVIESCPGIDMAYYRIIALRILGLLYASRGQYADALKRYEIGLEDALKLDLESEIGHYYRLYGHALMLSGRLSDAVSQLKSACEFEKKAHPDSMYWEALSARQLGDALLLLSESEPTLEKKSQLKREAQEAYRLGLNCFDGQQARSPAPHLARIVKRLLFRSFSDNAFNLAMEQKTSLNAVAEIAAAGQNQATEMVSETQIASSWPDEQKTEFRSGREVFHRRLDCIHQEFDDYWNVLAAEYHGRRYYVEKRLQMKGQVINALSSYETAKTLFRLGGTDCILILFYLGENWSNMHLLDMKEENVSQIPLSFRGEDARIISQDYHNAMMNAESDPKKEAAAIRCMLKCYETILEPHFLEILPKIQGRRLVFIPMRQMNEVPIHALKVGEKLLLQYCKISYCPSLGVFLKLFSAGFVGEGSIFALHDRINTEGFFTGAFRSLEEAYSDRLQCCRKMTWSDILSGAKAFHASDMMFACHGHFEAKNPAASSLQIGWNDHVSFSKIFAEMDLSGTRSVTLAACDSGLVRTELAEEYSGLAAAFLSAGVRNVVSSLWKVNELATSILLSRHFLLLSDGDHTVADALCESELSLKEMKREDVIEWINKYLPEFAIDLIPQVKKMGKKPFEDPYYWAGFYSLGGL